jgi:hypothetical protein
MSLGHVAGQNTNSLQKTECKNVAKSQSAKCSLEFRPPFWISDAILNLAANSPSIKYVRSKYKAQSKNRTQKSSKLRELWSKNQFSAILKTWKMNFIFNQ